MTARRVAGLVCAAAGGLLLLGAPALDATRRLSARLTGESADVCGFRAQYGVDCLGCGGTRAFAAGARGRFVTAFRLNRLGAVIALDAWLTALAALVSAIRGRLRVLGLTTAAILATLPVVMVVHAILWWRGLPPNIRWG